LERAIQENNNVPFGIETSTYYTVETGNDSDPLMKEGNCKMIRFMDQPNQTEPHFHKSGYSSIEVQWGDINEADNNDTETFSCWEVTVPKYQNDSSNCPSLSDKEKEYFHKVIDKLASEGPEERSFSDFNEMVDCSLYANYLEVVEVPMYLSLIRIRIDNYYSNKLSLYEDIKLIMENCIKYNDAESPIVAQAILLKERFFEILNDTESEKTETSNSNQTSPIVLTNRRVTRSVASPENNTFEMITSPSTLEALPKPIAAKATKADKNVKIEEKASSDRKVTRKSHRTIGNSSTPSNESATCVLQQPIQASLQENHKTPDSVTSRLRSRTRLSTTDPDDSMISEHSSSRKRHRENTTSHTENSIYSDSDRSNSPPSKKKLAVAKFGSDFSENESNYDTGSEDNSTFLEEEINRPQRSSTRSGRKKNIVSNDSYNPSDSSDGDSDLDLKAGSPPRSTRRTSVNSGKRRTPRKIDTSDEDEFHDEESMDSDEDTPSKRTSLRTRKKTKKAKYLEGGYSSDEFVPVNRKKRKAPRSTKKKKQQPNEMPTEDELFYPDVQKWPSISDPNLMRKVAYSVMDKVVSLYLALILNCLGFQRVLKLNE